MTQEHFEHASAAYTPQVKNPTYAYVQAFIDELQRADVHNVVICPGSRSTPLAIAVASHPDLKAWMHIDERSAAYFALGMAKKLNRPVALICTSGTAAANFFPAIAEANLTHVPLLVVTADRPHELRENGAPQAIDQIRLYGAHTKWFVEVALPEASNPALRYIRTLANRAVALTRAVPAGPVHLNFPFREPLTPGVLADQPLPPPEQRDHIAWNGRPNNEPLVAVADSSLGAPHPHTIQQLAARLQTIRNGLIIAGPYDNPALIQPLTRLAQTLGYPILADPLSQLRNGSHNRNHIISSYDAFLRLDPIIKQIQPEIIIRFGAMPTAKPLLLYLKCYPECPQIVIDAQDDWNEPTLLASQLLHTDPVLFCEQLRMALPQIESDKEDKTWLSRWQKMDRITRQSLRGAISDFTDRFEGRIFTELEDLLPEHATLFAGNSMPVRDMDTFYWGGSQDIQIMGNRGANGIDGIISSALGCSAATGQNERTVLVIGDLSFFHDLNGLLAARLHQLNLVVVLVNNDGGGIFSFLPQANDTEHFEQLFGTPTGLDFQPVVQMYGGTFYRPENWTQFRETFRRGITAGGLHVIEVRTERTSNVVMHRQLWKIIENALHNQED